MFREHFNLSRWAIEHPALVRYLMVVLLLMGIGAYFQLGQDEDPPFTFRAMVIRAAWPGATAMQVAEQVTDRLERTLQEVPYADKIRSYSRPGESLIIFQLKDTSPPSEVSQIWYRSKKIGDARASLPAGVQGPFFNDEFGDTFGVIYAMSAPGYAARDVRDFANQVRQELLRPRMSEKLRSMDSKKSGSTSNYRGAGLRSISSPLPKSPIRLAHKMRLNLAARCRPISVTSPCV